MQHGQAQMAIGYKAAQVEMGCCAGQVLRDSYGLSCAVQQLMVSPCLCLDALLGSVHHIEQNFQSKCFVRMWQFIIYSLPLWALQHPCDRRPGGAGEGGVQLMT